jgi:glycosyltransferase involved in cell wall biosynthesis
VNDARAVVRLITGEQAPKVSATRPILLLDISRLIWRGLRVAPTGIDRVELAYAQHFLLNCGDRPVLAVLHLFGFLFAVSPTGARQFVENLSERWRGRSPRTRGGHFSALVKTYFGLLNSKWLGGRGLRKKLRASPVTPIFLVASHNQISFGFAINRIRAKFKAKAACLIHDLIPLDFPEYFPAGWERRHRRLLKNTALFDGVIANSEATARSLRSHLEPALDNPIPLLNIRVALLGASAFPRPAHPEQTAEMPYFVVLGTIEPRKNHLLLLNLWARLASTVRSPPRLIVIGARGWENEQIADMLERSKRLRGLVREYNRLADAEIGAMLSNARALLVPSFAEGFGLPLAEGLCSGVPVICSDIPPFREVGGEAPEYLDPLDLRAWLGAVLDYSQPNSLRRTEQLSRLSRWQAPTWASHFAIVDELLEDLGGRQASPVATAINTAQETGEPLGELDELRIRRSS